MVVFWSYLKYCWISRPQRWWNKRMERDLKAMWVDGELNMLEIFPRKRETFCRKRESWGSIWQVWSIHWKGSHVEGDCCSFVCLQRAKTGPVGLKCKVVHFRRLGLELLRIGCLDQMLFAYCWWCSGWGWVFSSHRHRSKGSALGGRAGWKSLVLYQPCDFISPDSHSPPTWIFW